jgi:hypothetical protein
VDNSGLIRERDKYREMIRREKIEGVYTPDKRRKKIFEKESQTKRKF